MELWDKVKQPPATALKRITGGRLNGKSDISPQWRYQIMTEVFGICGVGWYYTIDKKWIEPVTEGQIVAFADITLYVKLSGGMGMPDEWSKGIPSNGGSMLIEKEKAGLHSSDEAYKMAITDALGTAMQRLGVAADIYMGKWDGSKYKDTPVQSSQEKTVQPSDVPEPKEENPQENLVKENYVFSMIKDVSCKEGTTNGKPWKLYVIETATGDKYATFSDTVVDNARTFKNNGQLANIRFEVTPKGKKQIVEITA